jgi:hypothetical protein
MDATRHTLSSLTTRQDIDELGGGANGKEVGERRRKWKWEEVDAWRFLGGTSLWVQARLEKGSVLPPSPQFDSFVASRHLISRSSESACMCIEDAPRSSSHARQQYAGARSAWYSSGGIIRLTAIGMHLSVTPPARHYQHSHHLHCHIITHSRLNHRKCLLVTTAPS